MRAVVRNGRCEIQNDDGSTVSILPPADIDGVELKGDYIVSVRRSGYGQLYTTDAKLVCTFTVNDIKYAKITGAKEVSLFRRNGHTEVRSFDGRLLRVIC